MALMPTRLVIRLGQFLDRFLEHVFSKKDTGIVEFVLLVRYSQNYVFYSLSIGPNVLNLFLSLSWFLVGIIIPVQRAFVANQSLGYFFAKWVGKRCKAWRVVDLHWALFDCGCR